MDALERVIRPIVEGQIRGFLIEHPAIVRAVDWYKPRDDKAVTLTNSLAKRIVRDLVCDVNMERIARACVEVLNEGDSAMEDGSVAGGDVAARSSGASCASDVELHPANERGQIGILADLAAALGKGKKMPTIIFAVDHSVA